MVLQEWVDKETEELILGMEAKGYLKSPVVERAIIATPRWMFVPRLETPRAYRDLPLEIGGGQTISQPSTVVIMTEALKVGPGMKVLEIGAGSGWQAGILARLVGSATKVYTIERLNELAENAKRNLENAGIDNVEVKAGDGSEGFKDKAPFDRIIVTAAVPDVPQPLVDQLKVGGRIVAPIGDLYGQHLFIITKLREGAIDRKDLGTFKFVPLIGKYGFKSGRS
jgi:protein-L-isoaspartate(D-aspartate) O-methyltransferase